MASGRAQVSVDGIGYDAVTQKIDASTIVFDATKVNGCASVGLAVTLSADDTVALCADGDAIAGKLIKVESDGFCTVQVSGFCTLPGGASATLTRLTTFVGALGASSARGYIRSAASGTAAELIKARGQIWNASDATNVVIKL